MSYAFQHPQQHPQPHVQGGYGGGAPTMQLQQQQQQQFQPQYAQFNPQQQPQQVQQAPPQQQQQQQQTGSISALVAALQNGSISKQQLYSSLTNMYKGQTPLGSSAAASVGGAAMPLQQSHPPLPPPSSSSFTTSASAPFTPHQQQQQQQMHFQQQQQQQQQQPFAAFHQPQHPLTTPSSSPFSFSSSPHAFVPPAASAAPSPAVPASFVPGASGGGGGAYTAAEAAAAQQHIQNFLSRHLAQGGGGAQSVSVPASAVQTPQQQQFQQQQQQGAYTPGYANAPQGYYDAQQMQQQQQQHDQLYEEAEEYIEHDSTRGSVNGGGGGGGSHRNSNGFYGGSGRASSLHPQHRSRSAARSSVRERMAAVYTDEQNAELTFKPNITPLPRNIYKPRGGGGVDGASEDGTEEAQAPFLGRVMHWSESKRARERQRAAELEKQSLAACTFRPTINDESVAIVEAPGPEQRRLFSARSTARAKIVEMETRRAEEERFRAECTFEPQLNRKSIAMAGNVAVRARPASASTASQQPHHARTGSSDDAALAACTFAPKVNAPKPHMRAAQLYLEQNAFERLSSSAGAKAPGSSRKSRGGNGGGDGLSDSEGGGYESEGGGGGRGRGRSHSRNGSASARTRSQGARSVSPGASARGGGGGAGVGAASSSSGASFGDFLARLKFKEFQRLERLEALKAAEQAAVQHGRPMLSKRSAQIVRQSIEAGTYNSPSKRRSSGSRSTSVERGALSSSASVPLLDAECTFAPSINAYSSALSRPRKKNFEAMSALEMARRAQNLERATQERLAAELAQASFTPFVPKPLSKKMQTVDARLRIHQDPESYLERVAFQNALKEAERVREQQAREEADLAQCTFAPQVHDAPAFVKRIAKAVAMNKAAAAAAQQQNTGRRSKPKPDWK
jgi:hypothetical protein